ncbi:MAG: hypothetical protein ABI778_06580 [Ignavibacteriota bacterium]
MLAFLVSLIYCAGIHGQDFTQSNSEYHISQYHVDNGARYSTSSPEDPAIDLTMECLAANGYGQWTISTATGGHESISGQDWIFSPNQIGTTWDFSNSTHRKGWFLLGNFIGKPSQGIDPSSHTATSSHPGCQSPGIVSGGEFNTSFPANTPKVTANLTGQVRYVWPDAGRTNFIIQGLDDASTSSSPQINIDLNGLPNPIVKRQIIKSLISTISTSISTNNGSGNKAVTTSGLSQDQYDIACDKAFIYIVWTRHNSGSGKDEIYATAVDINTGSTSGGVGTFQIDANGSTDFNRPTIAADPRYDGTSGPQFDIAYISSTSATNGTVIVKNFAGTGTTPAHTESLSKTLTDPFTTSAFTYTGAGHARILVSSGASSTSHSVYVLDNFNTSSLIDDDLILYRNLNWSTDVATYVDGKHNAGSYPSPFPIVSVTPAYSLTTSGILDNPIVAYANPYDAQNTNASTYDQFHCVYQPVYLSSGGPTKMPIQIVRGYDNGFGPVGPPPLTTDTRLLLSQDNGGLQLDPASYVAAINQMGGHIHWISGTSPKTHFYARDIRSFDEPIEENTLVTNNCYIDDGSSSGKNHGGTVGAEILDGKRLTIWTDPNYGAADGGSTDKGMYWQYPAATTATGFWGEALNVGSLSFNAAGLALTVGNNSTTTAALTTVPVCNIAKSGYDAAITINAGSKWDYYGSSVRADWAVDTWKDLTINLNGPSTGPVTPNLNIHAGAVFWECPSLNLDHARVDILFDANISPINSSANSSVTGLLRTGTVATITNSNINSFLPYSTWVNEGTTLPDNSRNVVMHIGGYGVGSNSIYNLHSSGSNYTNFASLLDVGSSAGGGIGVIFYDGPAGDTPPLDRVVIDGGTITQMRFHAINVGTGGVEITSNEIDNLDANTIFIEGENIFSGYSDIAISNNSFLHILNHGTSGTFYNPECGIKIQQLNDPSYFGEVNVNDNDFTFSGNEISTGHELIAAIRFINSTGNIERNKIVSYGAANGIMLQSTDFNSTYSYLCNDVVSGMVAGGILSDHNHGYVKLCKLSGNGDAGYLSEDADNVSIVASKIFDCQNSGIEFSSLSFATVDLTGVHGGGNDYAAFDTISGNGINTTTGWINAQIRLPDPYLTLKLGNLGGGTWSNWAENNIIQGSGIGTNLIDLLTGSGFSIGNIDHNYWGGISNGNSGDAVISTSLTFSPNPSAFRTTETFWSGSISCSGDYQINRKATILPLNVNIIPVDADTCGILKLWENIKPFSQQEAKEQYDTLCLYIQRCAESDDQSWTAFTPLDGAVPLYAPKDTLRYERYRNWLISVIDLNKTAPIYFCRCLRSIAGTFQYGKYYSTNAGIAVYRYLRSLPAPCNGQTVENTITQDSLYLIQNGLDTTIPPLDSLGLGFLLKRTSVLHQQPLPQTILASFTINPNPFHKEATLDFTMNRMSYVTLTVYDELGRPVWGDGRGSSLEAGTHSIHIDGNSLPSGTLYARISTGFGEVKTVKLVHEK